MGTLIVPFKVLFDIADEGMLSGGTLGIYAGIKYFPFENSSMISAITAGPAFDLDQNFAFSVAVAQILVLPKNQQIGAVIGFDTDTGSEIGGIKWWFSLSTGFSFTK